MVVALAEGSPPRHLPTAPAPAQRRRFRVVLLREGGRKPATWTRIDRDYEQIRINLHSLFHDLGINPAALAA